MAYPVILDLASAKTFIAFGERAAKHGLEPSGLQQFIDEPEKMDRFVHFAKAGAPLWQPAPKVVKALPNIDWLATYDSFGMKAEYEEAMKTFSMWSDPNLWIVPVIASPDCKKVVTCNMVVAGMRKSGIKVWAYYDDIDARISHNDRDPANGSYAIGFRRAIEADEENHDLSANVLASRGHKGTTCLERELLGYGYYLTTRQHLDVKNITLCPGSRDRDGKVPSVSFYPGNGGVLVAGMPQAVIMTICGPAPRFPRPAKRGVVSLFTFPSRVMPTKTNNCFRGHFFVQSNRLIQSVPRCGMSICHIYKLGNCLFDSIEF